MKIINKIKFQLRLTKINKIKEILFLIKNKNIRVAVFYQINGFKHLTDQIIKKHYRIRIITHNLQCKVWLLSLTQSQVKVNLILIKFNTQQANIIGLLINTLPV